MKIWGGKGWIMIFEDDWLLIGIAGIKHVGFYAVLDIPGSVSAGLYDYFEVEYDPNFDFVEFILQRLKAIEEGLKALEGGV